jgi:hypothetical protein
MNATYLSTVAQVIPVFLLAGVIEHPNMKRSVRKAGKRRWKRMSARRRVEMSGLSREEQLAKRLKHLDSKVDRALDRGAIVSMWVTLFGLPLFALAGEVAAFNALLRGPANGAERFLVPFGLSASFLYVAMPLMARLLVVVAREVGQVRKHERWVSERRAEVRGEIEALKRAEADVGP